MVDKTVVDSPPKSLVTFTRRGEANRPPNAIGGDDVIPLQDFEKKKRWQSSAAARSKETGPAQIKEQSKAPVYR
jgi:hypothetical protein